MLSEAKHLELSEAPTHMQRKGFLAPLRMTELGTAIAVDGGRTRSLL